MGIIGKATLVIATLLNPSFLMLWLGTYAAEEIKNTIKDGQDGRHTKTTIWGDRVDDGYAPHQPEDRKVIPQI